MAVPKNARPIIYVRGYAMTAGEKDATAADPFCGFNLGSTVYRAVPDKRAPARKYVFESPVVRLMSDFGYSDVYQDGRDILDPEWHSDALGQPTGNRLDSRSIIIYRYYDAASDLLGEGAKTPEIEDFARELGQLIVTVRDLVCANPANKVTRRDFRCYLVAHSMGGLICRALLQNPALDVHDAARYVDKLFTYATPHNGIDVAKVNVPEWLGLNDINNFNRSKRMSKYLALEKEYRKHGRVDLVPESRFSSRRVFCMVGTNRMDYSAAAGLARTFVGHGSDGLVLIENATCRGLNEDGTLGEPCAKAFTYRSHSGYFGIVNSEEAYQNLTRFLFGNVRVDVFVDVEDVRLPEALQAAAKKHRIDALYQIECTAAARGKLWYLTRRTAEEDSVSCFTHADWETDRTHYLSTVFLANHGRVNPRRRSLAYQMTLGVRVPDYEVDRRLWINEHYEGGYLFQNALVVEITPPARGSRKWKVCYAWQDAGTSKADVEVDGTALAGNGLEIRIPFESHVIDAQGNRQPSTPGIKGDVRLMVSAWS
ncbi:MAG TPA: hypothetical protein VKZ85_00850 [Woeseiaceae bacterium]|nr:hypothetical protein [Woeseiaceae bacterium]